MSSLQNEKKSIAKYLLNHSLKHKVKLKKKLYILKKNGLATGMTFSYRPLRRKMEILFLAFVNYVFYSLWLDEQPAFAIIDFSFSVSFPYVFPESALIDMISANERFTL